MKRTPATMNVKATDNPLGGSFGVRLFVILVSSGVIVSLLCCSTALSWKPQTCSTILQFFIMIVGAGWFAFSYSSSRESFLLDCLIISGISFPVFFMLLTSSAVFFWMSLLIFTALGVQNAVRKAHSTDQWESLLVGVYAAWVVSGIFVTLGSSSLLPYAESAISASNISLFLNVRFVLTALVIAALVGKSMLDAINGPEFNIASLPALSISDDGNKDDVLGAIFSALVLVANTILLVIQKITNLVWQVIALIGVFLFRTGVNLGNLVVDLVTDSGIWFGMIRVVLTFVILIIFNLIIAAEVDRLYTYLRADTSLFVISFSDFFTLFTAGVIFCATLIMILIQCWLWDISTTPLVRAALGGAMFLAGFALSGFVIYVLSKIEILHIEGFRSLGVFTLLLILAVGLVFIYQLMKRATARKVQTD